MSTDSQGLKKQYVAKAQVTPAEEKRKVVFVVPFAVPCSGKSFAWNEIKKHIDEHKKDWTYESISSDEMRGKLIKQTMDQKKCTRD